jgi:hypothetical protein
MRALMKVGFSLLVLAFVLIGLSYSMLRAQGFSGSTYPEGRLVASETRTIGGGIVSVDLSGPIDMTLRQGAVPSLVVRGEQRLLGNVETLQEGANLRIGITGMLLHHRQPLQVTLVLPSLASLNVEGSGDSTVNGFSGERIEVLLNGSGNVKFNGRYQQVKAGLQGSGELEMNGGASESVGANLDGSGDLTVVGTCRELTTEQTGSGDLDARHLSAQQATVSLHGSGSSMVSASKMVNVTLRGSGDVSIYGSPEQRSINRIGSGEVTFKE